MSIQSVSPIRDFLFHPLSEKHSTPKKILSIITNIALTILTGGVFLAIFIGVNLYDHHKAPNDNTGDKEKNETKYDVKLLSGKTDLLSKHNTAENCWIAVSGKVYDITEFLEDHPGGDDVLLDMAGKDATQAFNDIGHSVEAVEEMANYYIGQLV